MYVYISIFIYVHDIHLHTCMYMLHIYILFLLGGARGSDISETSDMSSPAGIPTLRG